MGVSIIKAAVSLLFNKHRWVFTLDVHFQTDHVLPLTQLFPLLLSSECHLRGHRMPLDIRL